MLYSVVTLLENAWQSASSVVFFNTYCFALLIVALLSQECTSTPHIPHVQGLIPQAQLLCILFKTHHLWCTHNSWCYCSVGAMCAGLFNNLISMESRKHEYGGGVRFVTQRQGRGGAGGSGAVSGEPDWHNNLTNCENKQCLHS